MNNENRFLQPSTLPWPQRLAITLVGTAIGYKLSKALCHWLATKRSRR